MKSVAATAAAGTLLQQLLLLLESPGAVVAQGPSPGRASDSVVTKDSRPAAELDRSILLEWRASRRIWALGFVATALLTQTLPHRAILPKVWAHTYGVFHGYGIGLVLFAEALSRHSVSYSLHIYPRGAHGIGLGEEAGYSGEWTDSCAGWLIGPWAVIDEAQLLHSPPLSLPGASRGNPLFPTSRYAPIVAL